MPRPVVDLGDGRVKLWLRPEIETWTAKQGAADERAQSAASVADPGCRSGPSAACGPSSPRGRSVCSSDIPGPPSLHSRFGDGLDGRRQIGSKPVAGDVGSTEAPRALRQAPPTHEPDEPRPVLGGGRCSSSLAMQETLPKPGPCSSRPRDHLRRTNRPCSGPVTAADPIASEGGAYSSALAPCRPRGCASPPTHWPAHRGRETRMRSRSRLRPHDRKRGHCSDAVTMRRAFAFPWRRCPVGR
jgi:hypothetical protein